MVKISWWRLVIDISVLVVLVLFSQVALSLVEPHKSGFYCNDFSVNLPFRESTVSNAVLGVISIVIPFVLMVGTELVRWIMIRVNRSKITGRKPIHYGVNACCWGQRNVPEIFGNFLANYGKICGTRLKDTDKGHFHQTNFNSKKPYEFIRL